MTAIRLIGALGVASLLCAGAVTAQVPARTFALYEENDAFATSDSAYTQGIRLLWNFSVWKGKAWSPIYGVTSLISPVRWALGKPAQKILNPCVPRIMRGPGRPCGTIGFSLGQTMYTPATLTTSALRPDDRPYAGYLFASGGFDVLYDHAEVSTELMLGVTGPASLAREAQSLAHWTWSSDRPRPRGWGNQIHGSPHAMLVNNYSWRPGGLEYCRYGCDGSYAEGRVFDVTPRAELALGTLMTRVSPGMLIRLGSRFPETMNAQRIPTTASTADTTGLQLWWMGFFSFDGRFLAHNALISGTPWADGYAGGWRDSSRIETRHALYERALGIAVGWRAATISIQHVTRGAEYSPGGGPHKFGSVSIAIHSPERAARPRVPSSR